MANESDPVDPVNAERFSGDVSTEGDVEDMLSNLEEL